MSQDEIRIDSERGLRSECAQEDGGIERCACEEHGGCILAIVENDGKRVGEGAIGIDLFDTLSSPVMDLTYYISPDNVLSA